MVRSVVMAAAMLMVAGASNAFAAVDNNTYIIDIRATASGDIKARMEFDQGLLPGRGKAGIDIEDAGDYTGRYTTGALGGLPAFLGVTYTVNSSAPDDGFFSSLSGVQLFKFTAGVGFSTSGDLFFFTGERLD